MDTVQFLYASNHALSIEQNYSITVYKFSVGLADSTILLN